MIRYSLSAAMVLLVFCLSGAHAEVVSSLWNRGGEGDWANPQNWSPQQVPNNDAAEDLHFAVEIDSTRVGSDEVMVRINESYTIDSLRLAGTVELTAPTWWVLTMVEPEGMTNHGQAMIDGFATIRADIHNHGRMEIDSPIDGSITNVQGGVLQILDTEISGTVHNHAGATFVAEYANDIEGDFLNEGTLTIFPPGDIVVEKRFNNAGQVKLRRAEISGGQALVNDPNGCMTGSGTIMTPVVLDNRGTIRARGGALVLQTGDDLKNTGLLHSGVGCLLHAEGPASFANNGRIQVDAAGAMVFSGNLINEAGANIQLDGGALAADRIVQKPGAAFRGFGSITGTLVLQTGSTVDLTGPTKVIGDIDVPAGATLTIAHGTTLVTGHVACDGTIVLKGARLVAQGGLEGDGPIISEPAENTYSSDSGL